MKPRLRSIFGQESWTLGTDHVEIAVTRQAGHMAPVRFRLRGRWIEPFEVAPWAAEELPPETPQVRRVLRGDFFCMPFGANESAYRDERYPPHGETANGEWKLESCDSNQLQLSMRTLLRPGRVDKFVRIVPGQTIIYQQHVISEIGRPNVLRAPPRSDRAGRRDGANQCQPLLPRSGLPRRTGESSTRRILKSATGSCVQVFRPRAVADRRLD